MAALLNFDPSSLGESQVTESPPKSPSTTADKAAKLGDIAKQLEAPIERLVIDCDGIRTTLEPIVDTLPTGLKHTLWPTQPTMASFVKTCWQLRRT